MVCPWKGSFGSTRMTRSSPAGFEIGILWERLNSLGSCHMAIHASNAEMVMRVAKATGCEFFGQELDDDRISVELFEPSR